MSDPTIQSALQDLTTAITALSAEAVLTNADKAALLAFAEAFKTAPKLGGNLDVDDHEIVSADGGDIVLRPDNEALAFGLRAPGTTPRILGATNTVSDSDNGRELYSDQSTAYTVTILSGVADWHVFALWSRGTGLPTISMSGAGTINGSATWTPEEPNTYTLFRNLGGNVWVTL